MNENPYGVCKCGLWYDLAIERKPLRGNLINVDLTFLPTMHQVAPRCFSDRYLTYVFVGRTLFFNRCYELWWVGLWCEKKIVFVNNCNTGKKKNSEKNFILFGGFLRSLYLIYTKEPFSWPYGWKTAKEEEAEWVKNVKCGFLRW